MIRCAERVLELIMDVQKNIILYHPIVQYMYWVMEAMKAVNVLIDNDE